MCRIVPKRTVASTVAIPYLEKIQCAGGFGQYETQVTKSLARIFIPKFPKLPAEVIPTIVQFYEPGGRPLRALILL